MKDTPDSKLLFIINPGSGKNKTDWPLLIQDYFKSLQYTIELFEIPDSCNLEEIRQKIEKYNPARVVAVGGDGTVKLVAECLLKTNIPVCILPAGSANGLAKELGIPHDPALAIELCTKGQIKTIHVIRVNNEMCIHLSDIGFNAFVVKKFETGKGRGMWGYIKATWKVLWRQPWMEVEMQIDSTDIKRRAAMIVIANATKYGSGALINPNGKLDDDMFEVIVVKKISVSEVFKMMFTHTPYNPAKTEVFQTSALKMESGRKAHFQVDGEYLGKINNIKANIILNALEVIVPEETN